MEVHHITIPYPLCTFHCSKLTDSPCRERIARISRQKKVRSQHSIDWFILPRTYGTTVNMPPFPLLFHSPNDWTSNQLEDLRLVRHFNASLDEILEDDYLPKDGDEGWTCTLSFIVVLEMLTYGRFRIARHGNCRTDRKRVKESLANSNTCPIQAQQFPASF